MRWLIPEVVLYGFNFCTLFKELLCSATVPPQPGGYWAHGARRQNKYSGKFAKFGHRKRHTVAAVGPEHEPDVRCAG
jgi:hypothetical protein